MKTFFIAGIIAAMACSLFATWRTHEGSKPEHQGEFNKQIRAQAITVHQQHPDWTVDQISAQIASDAARATAIGSLVTALVAIVLYALVSSLLGGERWWHLAVAFVLWIGGAVCIALV
jgi:hypothetical protein